MRHTWHTRHQLATDCPALSFSVLVLGQGLDKTHTHTYARTLHAPFQLKLSLPSRGNSSLQHRECHRSKSACSLSTRSRLSQRRGCRERKRKRERGRCCCPSRFLSRLESNVHKLIFFIKFSAWKMTRKTLPHARSHTKQNSTQVSTKCRYLS